METKQQNESQHLHIRSKENSDLIFLSIKDKQVRTERLRYCHITGQTQSTSRCMSFPNMRPHIRKEKTRISLQTSGYRTSELIKINNKLVFNSFRVMDTETQAFYNKIQEQINNLNKELQDYLNDKFMQLPFLTFDDVIKEAQPTENQSTNLNKAIQKKFKEVK